MPAKQMTIGAGNEGQAEAWDGGEGEVWAENPEYYERAVAHHQARLAEAAAIGGTDRVLDVGCGNGGSTIDAAVAATEGSALGIDLSSRMIAVATQRAAARGVGNVAFVQGDAQVYGFESATFDVAVSRFAAMFFADQVAAFTNIAEALRPGGRLVVVSWQAPDRNEWFSSFTTTLTLGRPRPAPPADAPSPFRHADPAANEDILRAAGFTDVGHEAIEAQMYFGADADEGYARLSQGLGWLTEGLTDDERTKAFDDLRSSLEAHATPDGVAFGSAAWLITARRA